MVKVSSIRPLGSSDSGLEIRYQLLLAHFLPPFECAARRKEEKKGGEGSRRAKLGAYLFRWHSKNVTW